MNFIDDLHADMNAKMHSTRRRFQFSLLSLMLATLFAAVGVNCLLFAEGAFWRFAAMTALAGGSFGAAAGFVFYHIRRFAAFGVALGIAFALLAAAT